MINIANLSKLLQSNNPEVVQSIINKIENLSESGGKTFEEVLQEVFSQLNTDKTENGQKANPKFENVTENGSGIKEKISKTGSVGTSKQTEKQALKVLQLENKVKLLETLQENFEKNKEAEISVSDDIASSKEIKEVIEKDGKVEQLSKNNENIQNNETKIIAEIEKNDLKELKESEVVQSLQKLYAQKTYRNVENSSSTIDEGGTSKKDTTTNTVVSGNKQLQRTNSTHEKDNFTKNVKKDELTINKPLDDTNSQGTSKMESYSKSEINQKSVNLQNKLEDMPRQIPSQKVENLYSEKNNDLNTVNKSDTTNIINNNTISKEKTNNTQSPMKNPMKPEQINQNSIKLEISQDIKNINISVKDKIANVTSSFKITDNVKTNQLNQKNLDTEKILVQKDEKNSKQVRYESVYLKPENLESLKNINSIKDIPANTSVNKIKEKNTNNEIFVLSVGVSNEKNSAITLNTKQEKSEQKTQFKNNSKDFEVTISTEGIEPDKQTITLRHLVDRMNYLITITSKFQQTNQINLNSVLADIITDQKVDDKKQIEPWRTRNSVSNSTLNHTSYITNSDKSTTSLVYILNQISQIMQSSNKQEVEKEDKNTNNQLSGVSTIKLSDFVKELRITTDINVVRNYTNSEEKIEKSTKTEVKDKMLSQKQLNYQTNYQNEQVQREFADSQSSYQKSYSNNSNNDQVELRKNTSESSKNNLEVKSFQVEYREKKEFESEKHSASPEDKPKISNKFIERLAELTYKGSEQKNEVQSNFQTGRYELAERLQASRNLEQIYEKIREFASLNKIEERVQMKLVPENLGNLDVEMKKEGKQLALLFVAENEKAKEVIEKNIHALRERLVELDFDIRRIEVKIKEEEKYHDHEQNHQHPHQQEQNQDENKKRYTYREVNQDDDERERNV